jgi:hypothetical protein
MFDEQQAHPLDKIALRVLACAVTDSIKRYGMDTKPVPPSLRSEARMWLQSTGAEWVEALGGDIGILEQTLKGVTHD